MKLIQRLITSLCLCAHISIHCMEIQKIPVKLKNDESNHTVPLNVVQKSITMNEKHLCKQLLAIAAKKPIVLHDVSPQQLTVFSDAAHTTEKTFPDFYEKLTETQKNDLITAIGEDRLNSPEITALLAQNYFFNDLQQQHYFPHMEKEIIKRRMQHAMIMQNIRDSSLPWKDIFLQSNNKTFSCTNGTSYEIPADFDAHTDLYTTNLLAQIQLYDLSNPDDLTLTYIKKNVGSYEYRMTETSLDTGPVYYVWRIKDDQIIKKEIFLGGRPIITAICSADGNFIAICTDHDTHINTVLLALDHASDEFIGKEIKLTQSLSKLIDIQFSKVSHALFVCSQDKNTNKLQLLMYDLHNHQEKLMLFNGLSEAAPAINHDASRMILCHVRSDAADTLSVWNISSLLNPMLLGTINTTQLGFEIAQQYNERHKANVRYIMYVTAIQYMHASNNAVAQLHNGNMLFIDESDGEITPVVSIHPHTYPSSKFISYSSLLHTPDNNFLVSHGSISSTDNDQYSYITVWDIQSKKIISSQEQYHLRQYPLIIMSSDTRSFIVNVGKKERKVWLPYTLFTAEDQATCDWIDNPNHTLFSLYALHRLYKAHMNNEEIIVDKDDALDTFLQTFPTTPHNIRQCIEKYLIVQHKKDFLETMETHAQALVSTCEEAFDACKSFFQNLGK